MELGAQVASKLEPFLLVSKSAKGAAAAKLIQDATAAPGVYVFGELLDLPNIQELGRNEEHVPYLSLLQLFAYKTFDDYMQHQDSLPPLNQAQITKLKHLTLVSLAMESRILPYARLLDVLQVSTIRELEDLIIDAIYMEVIRGRLDQKDQQFEVEYTMGRDIEPGKVESMLSALQSWASTTSTVLATLDERLVQLSTTAAADKTAKEAFDKLYNATLAEVTEKQKEVKLAARPVNTLKSGPTAAGQALLEREREKERQEKEKEKEREQRDNMEIDEPEVETGKTRSRESHGGPTTSRKRGRP